MLVIKTEMSLPTMGFWIRIRDQTSKSQFLEALILNFAQSFVIARHSSEKEKLFGMVITGNNPSPENRKLGLGLPIDAQNGSK